MDSTGAAFVIGLTYSPDFPTKSAYQLDQPSSDCFVTKLSPTGSLVWSTYLGGDNSEICYAIALENNGAAVHVTGETTSANFPTAYPYQLYGGEYDAFVTKLVFLGSSVSLASSTYLGGNSNESPLGIAVNGAGYVAVTGVTSSTDFPVYYALQPKLTGLKDVFVTVFRPQRGGTPELVFVGGTDSADFPRHHSTPHTMQSQDAFVARIASGPLSGPPSLSLVYSAVFGGLEYDHAFAVSGDASGAIYVAGLAGAGFY